MKKALPIALVILALTALLMACGQSAEEPPTSPEPTPSAVQTEPAETPSPAPTPEPMAAPQGMTQFDLEIFYQGAYDAGRIYAELEHDAGEVLEQELETLDSFFEVRTDLCRPANLEAEYLAWREANYPKEAETPETTPEPEVPASNPETQPSGNNQPQPVSNQSNPETGEVNYWNPNTVEDNIEGFDFESHRIDPDKTQSAEDAGYAPIDPSKIIYGN